MSENTSPPPENEGSTPPAPESSQWKTCLMIGGCLGLIVVIGIVTGLIGIWFLVESKNKKVAALEEALQKEKIAQDEAARAALGKKKNESTEATPEGRKDKTAPSALQKKTISATKAKPYQNILGMRFVPVPIGGGPSRDKRILFSIWETRMRDYAAFAEAREKEIDKENTEEATEWNQDWKRLRWKKKNWNPADEEELGYPVVNVSIEEAREFCQWLTRTEQAAGRLGPNDVYRLPTDSEWSYAAGIGEQEFADWEPPTNPENHKNVPARPRRIISPAQRSGEVEGFPWGKKWPPPDGVGNYSSVESPVQSASGRIQNYKDGFAYTAPVGSYKANALGIHDLGGNVWEYCDDKFSIQVIPRSQLADDVDPNIQFPKTKSLYVMRGGSWIDFVEADLLSSHRSPVKQNSRHTARGFRVVLEN